MEHGVPAHSVLVLEVGHGRQRPRPPLSRLDPPAQDAFKLTIGRNGQTGINLVTLGHKINLDHPRTVLTSTYIYVDLL